MHTCLHFLWSTLRCWEAHHRQPLTPPVSTLTSWSLQICERQLMPRLLKCQSCFWVPLSACQVKTILCWRNFIGVQTLKKVRGRFSYVLVEMDQKWMTSTDWSTQNSLPNLAIYLWGTEEAATFKMHFGPYFWSMLQGFFYLQLEAEKHEKWHVCFSNYHPFRNLPFWCDYMDREDIWHNDRKWENFYGSAATREFSIFLQTGANLLCYCTSIPSCPSSLPSVVSLLSTWCLFSFF